MDSQTTAIMLGALVIAGAAAAAVWWVGSRAGPAVGQQIDKTTGQLTSALQQTNATNARIADTVGGAINRATDVVGGVNDAVKAVTGILTTGKSLLDGASRLFGGLKLF